MIANSLSSFIKYPNRVVYIDWHGIKQRIGVSRLSYSNSLSIKTPNKFSAQEVWDFGASNLREISETCEAWSKSKQGSKAWAWEARNKGYGEG